MPISSSTADMVSRKLPKLVSADAHLAADYVMAGALTATGAWLWSRHRGAALASLICGGSLLGLTLLTSYPGKKRKYVSFPLHGKIEVGLAGVIAALPEILRLEKGKERRCLTAPAAVLTILSNLTSFRTPRPSGRYFS